MHGMPAVQALKTWYDWKVDVLCIMKTFTPWPARFFRSISCCSWRSGDVTVRRNFCNVTILGRMLPKTLARHQVSESGDVVTAFLMFWSDGGPALSFSQESFWIWVEVNEFWVCQEKTSKDHIYTWKALLISHKVVVTSFSPAWFQMATLCGTSREDGQRYVRRCVDNHAAVPTAKSQSFCVNPWKTWIHLALNKPKVWWSSLSDYRLSMTQLLVPLISISWLPDHRTKGGIGSSFIE